MARVEPDVEDITSEFDDKENSLHNSNVFPKAPSTEKGYEEFDVSELSMKLRYSITPTNSPMTRSFTANCKGDSGPNSLNNTAVVDNNITRSLNSTVTKTESLKSAKLPLQVLPTSMYTNSDRNLCEGEGNLTITITGTDNDDNLSLPSTSSSALQTPETTTPTKEIPKSEGSPIMRGLKSVLNMFIPTHRPISPSEDVDSHEKQCHEDPAKDSTVKDNSSSKGNSEIVSIHENLFPETPVKETEVKDSVHPQLVTSTPFHHDTSSAKDCQTNTLLASTPISNIKIMDSKDSSKRNSPLKESVIFNEDLERELQWQDETEIFFKNEKIPIHKLIFKSGPLNIDSNPKSSVKYIDTGKVNETIEYMDISNADVSHNSVIEDKTLNDIKTKVGDIEMTCVESDNEFVDCETTYSQNKSYLFKTAQESKTSPIVFQTEIIPYEACLEDHIEPINMSNIINNDEIRINDKTTELIVQSSSFAIHNSTSKNPPEDLNDLDMRRINLDTDDTNTNRILFKIDELLLNKIKLADLESTIVSNNTETTSECKKVSEISNLSVLNTTEEYLPIEKKAMNDTVVFELNEKNEDFTNSVKINEVSKIFEGINEKTLVPDENGDESILNTSTKDTVELEKIALQNIKVDEKSEFKMNVSNIDNSRHLPDEKENMSIIECELNTVDGVKNDAQSSFLNNPYIGPQKLDIEGSQDITMASLDSTLNLNNDQPISEINKTVIHEDRDYSSIEQNDNVTISEHNKLTESIKNTPTDLPQPLDVPLPSDDDIEKDSLLDLCSIKNSNVISQNETEETACVKKLDSNSDSQEAINQINLSKPFQSPNNQDVNILHNDSFNRIVDNLQTNLNSDVEMATVENNIVQDTFSLLSTNLTSFLQEVKVDTNKESQHIPARKTEMSISNDTFTSSDIVNKSEINVDSRTTKISLPDVVQAVNNTEKNNLSTQELKTDITNETVVLGVNINAKVYDDETVTSANNSPYVSVTELDLNITSSVPVDQSENPPKRVIEAAVSPPISPKLTRKGYNVNFDEIENPFATRTTIRMSPPPEAINKSFTPVNNNQKNKDGVKRRPPNRRMSQPEEKNPNVNKNHFNASIDRLNITNSNKIKQNYNIVHTEENKTVEDNNITYDVNNLASSVDLQKEISPSVKSVINYSYNSTNIKTLPDLENQTILHKSDENITSTEQNFNNNSETRSVFNIPEINDMSFNPFATKSRICVTPPPTEVINPLNIENDTEIVSDSTVEDKFKTGQLNVTVDIANNVSDVTNITVQENATVCIEDSVPNEIKVSANTSNIMSSINTEDNDITVREVNSEDEDTIEGPFFEAEDMHDVKIPDIEIDKDMMQFEPITSNNKDIDKSDFFIDAETFEFLLNQNKSNVVVDSGKESLFLKFDPLFAKRVSSDGALAALSAMQKKQSTPKKLTRASLVNLERAEIPMVLTAGPSNVTFMPEVENEEIISTVSKPMMVVNPAVAKQPVATSRISLTPKTNRLSLNFASPGMVAIDRLLSLSGNTSLLDLDVTTDTSRNHEANIILVQQRELLAEKELYVNSLKCESKELIEKLTILESQVKNLENEGEERLKKVNMLNEHLAEKTKINKSMAFVVEEYERTKASLIVDLEREKKRNAEERMRLINERDEQTAHLASMERSFSDLLSKYEKSKQIILSMKASQDCYKKSFTEFEENLLKMQKNYDMLKQHATSKLNNANLELEKMKRAYDVEVLKLNAMIKRKEVDISSLEETVTQKTKANEELASIYDYLINKLR